MGKSTINVPCSIAMLNYQRGMLAGFPMKLLHLKQFVDHMNVEYGNGLSLIVVTHAVASLSTRLRHSKVKKTSWVKWPFGNEFNGKNISKKFRIPMDFQKNNEFLWKNPMSFGKKQWIPMNGKIHGLSIAVCIFRLPGPNEISWFKAWLIVGVARGDISN